jgi:4-amino-4-deoxy-L-arabinose transferase-like glycosyltransferase
MTGSFNRRHLLLVALLCLAAVPYFTRLGASSLWDANEAFYAETPRRMIESGDLINPSFNNQPRFNKPPLSYWVVAVFYKLFGVSATSERLAIALGAILLIATAFALGRLLYSTEAGLYAALALAIAPRFLMFSRRIMIDVYMAMWMAAALLFFALAEARPNERKRYLILMYVAVGLGVLTKGPAAALLPALAVILYLALHRELRRWREMMLPLGALIVAAIVSPWYLAIYEQHGWHYISTFILKDNLSRYTQPVWGPRRGVFFYIPVVFGDMFPWSLFLIPVLLLAARGWLQSSRLMSRLRRNRERGLETTQPNANEVTASSSARLERLCLIWVAVIVGFFSLSQNKEDLYILPIYPAAAALVGAFLARAIEAPHIEAHIAQPWRNWARWMTAAMGGLIAASGLGVLYLFAHSSADYQFDGARLIGAIAATGGLIALALSLFKRRRLAVTATALTVVAFNLVFVARTLADFERFKPVRPFCEVIQAEAPADALVGYYRYAAPSMVFYLRRPVFEYYRPEELLDAWGSGRAVYCVMLADEYEALRPQLPTPARVLASRPVFQVKLKFILEKKEPPQLLLITNQGGAVFAE